MSEAPTPIELVPARRTRASRVLRTIRVAGRQAHLALALAVLLGVFLQVYLIGAYFFGAGQGALDAHRTAGWTVHGIEMLVLIAALIAWLPRVDLVLSLLLAVIGTVQVGLASESRWVGGLHPLFALIVLSVAAALTLRAVGRRRDARHPRTS